MPEKVVLDMIKHVLLKNIHIYIHSLHLLNFVCIVVIVIEIELEKAKLAILEWLE